MANAWDGKNKILTVDTQDADPAAFDALLFGDNGPSQPVYVKSVRWTGAADTNLFEVVDAAGNTLLAGKSTGADDDILVEKWWYNSFAVPDLDGGVLYVYMD